MYVFYCLITIIILWRRCWRDMAKRIIVLNVKYVILLSTLVNQIEYVVNAKRKTVWPSPHLPDVAKSVFALFAIVPVSEITWKTVGVTIQSHVTPAVHRYSAWTRMQFIILQLLFKICQTRSPVLYWGEKAIQCQVVEICFLQLLEYSKHDWHWNKATRPRS